MTQYNNVTKTKTTTSTRSGVGFGGLLALLFIYLKLVGTVSWPWIWVLAPLWGPIAFLLGVALIAAVIVGVIAILPSK